MPDIIFPDGLSFFPAHKNSPPSIKGSLSFNIGKFIEFADQYSVNGLLKIDVRESLKNPGLIYLALNTYKKIDKESPKAENPEEIAGVTFDRIDEEGEDSEGVPDEIPF